MEHPKIELPPGKEQPRRGAAVGKERKPGQEGSAPGRGRLPADELGELLSGPKQIENDGQ